MQINLTTSPSRKFRENHVGKLISLDIFPSRAQCAQLKKMKNLGSSKIFRQINFLIISQRGKNHDHEKKFVKSILWQLL